MGCRLKDQQNDPNIKMIIISQYNPEDHIPITEIEVNYDKEENYSPNYLVSLRVNSNNDIKQ